MHPLVCFSLQRLLPLVHGSSNRTSNFYLFRIPYFLDQAVVEVGEMESWAENRTDDEKQ